VSDLPPEPGTIIEVLERDHRVIKGQLDRFQVSSTDEWGEVLMDLIRYLIRHEVAEEEVVYKRLRAVMPASAEVVDDCLAEQERAAGKLVTMERLSPSDPSFREMVGQLRDDLLSHIAHEEQVVIPLIRNSKMHNDPEFVKRYEVARSTAPDRPEAVVSGEALPEGFVGGLLERVRQTVQLHRSEAGS
jgi:hemerythrin superfamily protein